MNAYEVIQLIGQIAATSSRTEKEGLTQALARDDLGQFVLKWTYDPFITFGLTAAPTPSEGKFNIAFQQSLLTPLLTRLSARDLTGNAAQREVAEVMQTMDADGAQLLFLILSKDLKCGIGVSTINTVMPNLIPTFGVMRANKYEEKKVKTWPRRAEWKLDGNRNTFICRNGNGGFFTRSGNRVAPLDHLVDGVLNIAKTAALKGSDALKAVLLEGDKLNFMLDGEAMMGLFADTGAFRRKSVDAIGAELHLYDMMSYADFDAQGSVGQPLVVRRRWLEEFVDFRTANKGTPAEDVVQIVPQFFILNQAEVDEFYDSARAKTLASYLARGDAEKEAALLIATIDKATGEPKVLEGAMIKDPDGLYDKKKSNGWLKMKNEDTIDLFVTAAYIGKPYTELENSLGGLCVDFDGVQVHVGGGYKADERDTLWADWLVDLANGTVTKTGKDITYVPNPGYEPILVGRMIEISYNEITPDLSLRHPNYVRFRDDKAGEALAEKAAA